VGKAREEKQIKKILLEEGGEKEYPDEKEFTPSKRKRVKGILGEKG